MLLEVYLYNLDVLLDVSINEVNAACQCCALCNGVGFESVQPFIEAKVTYLQAKPSHYNKIFSEVWVAMIDLPAAGSIRECILICQNLSAVLLEAPGCNHAWFKTLAFSLENQKKSCVSTHKWTTWDHYLAPKHAQSTSRLLYQHYLPIDTNVCKNMT